jgi:hypothetical protein
VGVVGPPWWDDRPTLIVGTGPSLHRFDFERLRGLGHVLAVKEAVWDLPFADACFGLDLGWIERRRDKLASLSMELYLAVPASTPAKARRIRNAVYLVRRRDGDLLRTDPGEVESGGNSGFGALNLAFLKRARRIVLLGYDYDGGRHYCPERYTHLTPGHNARYLPRWGRNFDRTAPQLRAAGVTVLNASLTSTVMAFPRASIDEALARLAHDQAA